MESEAPDTYVQYLVTENKRLRVEKKKTERRYKSLKESYLDYKHESKTVEKENSTLVAENWSYEAEMKVLDEKVEEMDKENENLKYEAVDNLIDQEYVAALESQKASLELKNIALQRRKARWGELARSYAPAHIFSNEDFESVSSEMRRLELGNY